MATLYIAAILETAFWAAVEPHLPTGTVVRKTTNELEPKKQLAGNPASYPSVTLEGVSVVPVQVPFRTFGMMNPTTAAKMDFSFDAKPVFDFVVKTKKSDETGQAAILLGLRQGLFATANFPHLGITQFPVTNVSIGRSPRGRDTPGDVNVLRVPITFECRPKRSQVVAT